jgi:hypothetical protein
VLVVRDEIVVGRDAEKAEEAAVWLRDAMMDGMAPLVSPVPVEVEGARGRRATGRKPGSQKHEMIR